MAYSTKRREPIWHIKYILEKFGGPDWSLVNLQYSMHLRPGTDLVVTLSNDLKKIGGPAQNWYGGLCPPNDRICIRALTKFNIISVVLICLFCILPLVTKMLFIPKSSVVFWQRKSRDPFWQLASRFKRNYLLFILKHSLFIIMKEEVWNISPFKRSLLRYL